MTAGEFLLQLANSNFTAIIAGAGGFFIARWIEGRAKALESKKRYIDLLNAATNELGLLKYNLEETSSRILKLELKDKDPKYGPGDWVEKAMENVACTFPTEGLIGMKHEALRSSPHTELSLCLSECLYSINDLNHAITQAYRQKEASNSKYVFGTTFKNVRPKIDDSLHNIRMGLAILEKERISIDRK